MKKRSSPIPTSDAQDVARDVLIVDPMLATGGSAAEAIGEMKKRGCKLYQTQLSWCSSPLPRASSTSRSSIPM